MASSLPLLLSLLFIVSSSARIIPSHEPPTINDFNTATLPPPTNKPGPIQTNGRNYTKVCDPARFEDLGLDMADFSYCNKSIPYATRVKDLIGRMSLSEKVHQLGDRSEGSNRIGLHRYQWWAEALHGIADTGHATYFGDVALGATSFANVILTAASFNETLWKKIGEATSTEGRALYNLGHTGLTFWSPNVNVARDPRWGRILETPGEDPLVVGRFGVNFVRGLQDIKGKEVTEDPNSRPLKVSSCCKHYAAYDLEEEFDHNRRTFDARVHEQDMMETFLRPFEMCIREGDASSVMCSFNKINGIPSCLNTRLMKQTIRDEWNLHGYIVSDCDSLDTIYRYQNWLGESPESAVADTTRAGLDLDCGLDMGPNETIHANYHNNYTLSAVAQGKMRETDIDNALTNLFTVLMRLGFFDNIPEVENLGARDICTKEHIELSTDSARQGIVLLKNNGTLPLPAKKNDKKLKFALIGPHLNATDIMRGNYAGPPCRYTSPLDAFSREVDVVHETGCSGAKCENPNIVAARKAAENADVTFVFGGLDLKLEAEERDRSSLLLPVNQSSLITNVIDAAKGKVVLVLFSGGGLDVSFAEKNPKVGAILWVGYPGEEGGQAIADVVFGRHNPGGKLPITWYKDEYVDLLPITSMQLRPDVQLGYPGRTYKFYQGDLILYPFGHGLSYTNYAYALNSSAVAVAVKIRAHQHCKALSYSPNISAPACPSVVVSESPCEEAIKFTVNVTNTGSVAGAHPVLVYSKAPVGVEGAPLKQLVGYERVFVPAKGSKGVEFELNVCKALGVVDKTAYHVLPHGKHTVTVGDGDVAVSFPVEINFATGA